MCVCIYSHICTPSLHVGVYRFTYMHSEFTCVLVYVFTYMHPKYTCVWVYGCVLHVCVGVYIYTCTHERHHGCIQIHCVRIGIHAYVSVLCVWVYVYTCIHIYMKRYRVHIRIYMCVSTYLHVCTPTSHVGV